MRRKDYFGNEIPFCSLFMWNVEVMNADNREIFNREFNREFKRINPQLTKSKLEIINAIIFEELITKGSIALFLRKDFGNTSRTIDSLLEMNILKNDFIITDGERVGKFLTIDKKFYKQYMTIINSFFEKMFYRNFIELLNRVSSKTNIKEVRRLEDISNLLWKNKDNI